MQDFFSDLPLMIGAISMLFLLLWWGVNRWLFGDGRANKLGRSLPGNITNPEPEADALSGFASAAKREAPLVSSKSETAPSDAADEQSAKSRPIGKKEQRDVIPPLVRTDTTTQPTAAKPAQTLSRQGATSIVNRNLKSQFSSHSDNRSGSPNPASTTDRLSANAARLPDDKQIKAADSEGSPYPAPLARSDRQVDGDQPETTGPVPPKAENIDDQQATRTEPVGARRTSSAASQADGSFDGEKLQARDRGASVDAQTNAPMADDDSLNTRVAADIGHTSVQDRTPQNDIAQNPLAAPDIDRVASVGVNTAPPAIDPTSNPRSERTEAGNYPQPSAADSASRTTGNHPTGMPERDSEREADTPEQAAIESTGEIAHNADANRLITSDTLAYPATDEHTGAQRARATSDTQAGAVETDRASDSVGNPPVLPDSDETRQLSGSETTAHRDDPSDISCGTILADASEALDGDGHSDDRVADSTTQDDKPIAQGFAAQSRQSVSTTANENSHVDDSLAHGRTRAKAILPDQPDSAGADQDAEPTHGVATVDSKAAARSADKDPSAGEPKRWFNPFATVFRSRQSDRSTRAGESDAAASGSAEDTGEHAIASDIAHGDGNVIGLPADARPAIRDDENAPPGAPDSTAPDTADTASVDSAPARAHNLHSRRDQDQETARYRTAAKQRRPSPNEQVQLRIPADDMPGSNSTKDADVELTDTIADNCELTAVLEIDIGDGSPKPAAIDEVLDSKDYLIARLQARIAELEASAPSEDDDRQSQLRTSEQRLRDSEARITTLQNRLVEALAQRQSSSSNAEQPSHDRPTLLSKIKLQSAQRG